MTTAVKEYEREMKRLKFLLQLLKRMQEEGRPEHSVQVIEDMILEARDNLHAMSVEFPELELKMEKIVKDRGWILRNIT